MTDYKTPAEAREVLSLDNVDNTSDANKPVSSATQSEIDALPDQAQIDLNSAIAGLPSRSLLTVGALTATGTPYSSTRFVGPANGTPIDSIIRSVTFDVTTGPFTAQIIIVKMIRQNGQVFQTKVLAVKNVSGLGVGAHTVDLGTIVAPAGSRVLIRRSAGAIDGDGTTKGSCEVNIASSTVDAIVNISLGINRALAIQLNYIALPSGTIASGATRFIASEESGGATFDERGGRAGSIPSAAANQRIEIGADIGADIPVGSNITGVSAGLSAETGKAVNFVLSIHRRTTADGEVDNDLNTGSPEYIMSKLFTGASLGLVVDGAEKDVMMNIPAIEVETGYTYYACVSGLEAGGGLGAFAFAADYAKSTTKQRRRGWRISGTSSTGITTVDGVTPVSLRLGFIYQKPLFDTLVDNAPTRAHVDRIVSADLTVDGLDVTTSLALSRDYVVVHSGETRTISAAAAGKVRFDILYLDRSLLRTFSQVPTFGLAAGTEREDDAPEFIPTVNALMTEGRTPIAYIRVTDAAVSALPVWDMRNANLMHLAPEIALDRERNQRILQRVLGRIYRGTALKIGGIGDSIMAIGTGSSVSVPNGAARDRGATLYFDDNIGSDIVDALPLFTSVQQGRPDDGAGAAHTKNSFMWTFVEAIQKRGGQALGSSALLYNNWGINSKRVQNLYMAGSASTWLTNFCADGADLVVINMGMNDYAFSTFGADYVSAIAFIKANTVDRDGFVPPIILMGIARPNNAISQSTWEGSSRVIRNVAYATDCAYVDLLPWYDNPNLRAIGMTGDDTCTANGNNHPGLYEHDQVMGRALVNLTI